MEQRESLDGRVRISFEGGTDDEKTMIVAVARAALEQESEPCDLVATLRRGDFCWWILEAQRHLPRIAPRGSEDPTSRIMWYKPELAEILTAAGIGAQATPD